jgi:hypothetical protein
MLTTHINKLIDELPYYTHSDPILLDLVFEGGLFNGSYLIGALHYLRELELRNRIKIDRISGCSVGSLTALVYFSNTYHLLEPIYKLTYRHFKKTNNVNIFNYIFDQLRPHLTPTIMATLNGRLFITYYNLKHNEQIVRHKYHSIDDLFDTIRKSCYCPYVIDHSFLYKKKYVDGFYPYVFPVVSNKKKVMYFNIHRFDKLFHGISIKNEKTNYRRIMTGILEAHTFFAYGYSTSMCSFVNDWTLLDCIEHYFYLAVLKMIVLILHKIYKLTNVLDKVGISFGYYKLLSVCYTTFIKTYCI